MADFAAPTPEDDQQPAASAEVSAESTSSQTPSEEPTAAEPTIADSEPILETAPDDSAAAATVEWSVQPGPAEPEPEATAAADAGQSTEAVATAEPPSTEPSAMEAPVVPLEPMATEEQPATAEPAAAPAEPAPAPSLSDAPSIASTIEVPASAPTEVGSEGGEWDLLVQKVSAWLRSGQLEQQWQAARTPLSLLAGLIALLLVLRVYNALLAVIEGLPLLPGLLELVGVIAVARFSLSRLVRTQERQQLIQGLKQRWKSFRGQG